MKRLFHLLLAMMLVLPAAAGSAHQSEAQPHRMSMAMSAHHHGAAHGQDSEAPPHGQHVHHECIGCIAPIDIAHYRPSRAARLAPARAVLPADAAVTRAHAGSPEPPPPRGLA